MLNWVIGNMGTIAGTIVLLAVIGAVISLMIRDRRKGKTSCGGGCAGCPMSGSCKTED